MPQGIFGPQPSIGGINKMSGLFKNTFRYVLLHMLEYIPWAKGMRKEAVRRKPYILWRIPDHYKTHEMCEIAVEKDPWALDYVPNHLKTQEKCQKAVEKTSWQLGDIPYHF